MPFDTILSILSITSQHEFVWKHPYTNVRTKLYSTYYVQYILRGENNVRVERR